VWHSPILLSLGPPHLLSSYWLQGRHHAAEQLVIRVRTSAVGLVGHVSAVVVRVAQPAVRYAASIVARELIRAARRRRRYTHTHGQPVTQHHLAPRTHCNTGLTTVEFVARERDKRERERETETERLIQKVRGHKGNMHKNLVKMI